MDCYESDNFHNDEQDIKTRLAYNGKLYKKFSNKAQFLFHFADIKAKFLTKAD